MRVAVVGGSGFIGSNLVLSLSSHGYDVKIIDRVTPKIKDIEFESLDCLDIKKLTNSLSNIDAVYMLANDSSAPDIDQSMIAKNVKYVENILYGCKFNNVKRLLFASSVWLDGTQQNAYTEMKQRCEGVIKSNVVPYTIMRYGIPYGPYARENLVIPVFYNKATCGDDINVFGSGGRRFIHVADLCEMNVRSLEGKYINQTVRFNSSEFTSLMKLAMMINSICGNKSKIINRQPRSIDFNDAKSSKVDKDFMDLNKINLVDGLKMYHEYMHSR